MNVRRRSLELDPRLMLRVLVLATALREADELGRAGSWSEVHTQRGSHPYLALPDLTLPCIALPYLALPCLALPYLALPCLASPRLALPCLALACLALPYLT